MSVILSRCGVLILLCIRWQFEFVPLWGTRAQIRAQAWRTRTRTYVHRIHTRTQTYAFLGQILTNALSNALKFTHDGSVRVKASVSSEMVTLTVIDTGVGVSEESMEKLFQPFSQACALFCHLQWPSLALPFFSCPSWQTVVFTCASMMITSVSLCCLE